MAITGITTTDDERLYYGTNISQAPLKANKGSFFIVTDNGLETGNIIDTYVFTKVWEKIGGIELSDIPDASETQRGLVNTDTTTAQQLGNGNKIIKGGATGNAFEIKNNINISKFVVDTILSRVGINKNTPTETLDVNGTGAFLQLIKLLHTNGDTYLKLGFTNNIYGLFGSDGWKVPSLVVGTSEFMNPRIRAFIELFPSNSNNIAKAGSIDFNVPFFDLFDNQNRICQFNFWSGVVNQLCIDGKTHKVGIGTTTPQAKLDVVSTTSGFLPPRMTQAQREAISLPATGLMVYQTDGTEGLYIKKSTGWVRVQEL